MKKNIVFILFLLCQYASGFAQVASDTLIAFRTVQGSNGTMTKAQMVSGFVSGSGTTNRLAMYTGANTIGNSPLSYDGNQTVSLNATFPNFTLNSGNGTGQFNNINFAGAWANGSTALGGNNVYATIDGYGGMFFKTVPGVTTAFAKVGVGVNDNFSYVRFGNNNIGSAYSPSSGSIGTFTTWNAMYNNTNFISGSNKVINTYNEWIGGLIMAGYINNIAIIGEAPIATINAQYKGTDGSLNQSFYDLVFHINTNRSGTYSFHQPVERMRIRDNGDIVYNEKEIQDYQTTYTVLNNGMWKAYNHGQGKYMPTDILLANDADGISFRNAPTTSFSRISGDIVAKISGTERLRIGTSGIEATAYKLPSATGANKYLVTDASGNLIPTNLPTIPAAQVNSDWNATSGVSQILNKPTIPAGLSGLTTNAFPVATSATTIGNSLLTFNGVDKLLFNTSANTPQFSLKSTGVYASLDFDVSNTTQAYRLLAYDAVDEGIRYIVPTSRGHHFYANSKIGGFDGSGVYAKNGSTTPAYRIDGTNTGFNGTSSLLSLVVNGSAEVGVNSSGLYTKSFGSSSAPSHSFIGGEGYGMSLVGISLTLSAAGGSVLRMNSSTATFDKNVVMASGTDISLASTSGATGSKAISAQQVEDNFMRKVEVISYTFSSFVVNANSNNVAYITTTNTLTTNDVFMIERGVTNGNITYSAFRSSANTLGIIATNSSTSNITLNNAIKIFVLR